MTDDAEASNAINNISQELYAWDYWAESLCRDFRIPNDGHSVSLRMSINQWMIDHNESDV